MSYQSLFGEFSLGYYHFEEVRMTGKFQMDTRERLYGASFLSYADRLTTFVSCTTDIDYTSDTYNEIRPMMSVAGFVALNLGNVTIIDSNNTGSFRSDT